MAALELAQLGLLAGPTASGTTVSMAAGNDMKMPSESLPPEISFPYGFPRPGRYRIFVQIKRAGHIETGAFDVRAECSHHRVRR